MLKRRQTEDGGFAPQPGEAARPDATAWAILALQATGAESATKGRLCQRLAADQSPDGRVSVAPGHEDAYWPTSLAVMAWEASPGCRAYQQRGLAFLLQTRSRKIWFWDKFVFSHDPHLKGWSWIMHTAAWVEPTAMALTALKLTGQGRQARATEAVRLLLNRQMPHGGWNTGNTVVFEQELHPNPESTAIALNALAGLVARESVEASLAYLRGQVAKVRTPLSLGWGLLGLGAWGERPPAATSWLAECLKRQDFYGSFDTANLALLMVASRATGGLESIFPTASG